MEKPTGNTRWTGLLLEILMIVIGINIALWFESWFQDLEDADIEAQYMADLRDDLLANVESLELAIESGESKLARTLKFIDLMPRLAELPAEEQAQAIYTPSNYRFFRPSDYTYRAMQESGDFRLLRNTEIKRRILKLDRRHRDIATLQGNFLQALDDEYIPLLMNQFDIATMRVTDPALLENQLFRNFFVYTKQDTDALLELYRLTKSESLALLGLIEEETGGRSVEVAAQPKGGGG